MTALLLLLAIASPLALLAVHAWLARRHQDALRAQLGELDKRLDQLHARLEVTEEDLAQALTRTGVAEGLLMEKGIADFDEVEEMRRRLLTEDATPGEGEAIH